MEWSITQSTAPVGEPVTVSNLKRHSRVIVDADDAILYDYISTARRVVEDRTGRQLLTATWKLYLDEFPRDVIYLPYPPLSSVSSIEYVDTDGATQTWSSDEYRVDTDAVPARITEAHGESWPATRSVTQAVTVTYSAGYSSSGDDVPEPLLQAIRLLTAHYYENREQVIGGTVPREIPEGARRLMAPYRVGVAEDLYPGE